MAVSRPCQRRRVCGGEESGFSSKITPNPPRKAKLPADRAFYGEIDDRNYAKEQHMRIFNIA